jgi:dipeptidyl aminopeptidase/acylaminoacyl peptidase
VRPPRLRLLLVAVAAATILVAPAAATEDGLVTFSQQGQYYGAAIVGIVPGSSALTSLASIPGGVIQHASWSPKGDRLAYATDAYGHDQVVLSTVFDEQLLNTSTDEELDPAMAPDGATLAVAVQPFGGHAHLALFTAAGGQLNPHLTDGSSDARAPHWSPDGKQIAFDSDRSGSWDVFVMNADGTNVHDVTPSAANEHVTDWSPDGLSLLVTSDRSGGGDLYRVSLSTGARTQLTSNSAHDIAGVFAPSGKSIAFSSDLRGFFDVYTMNADGTGLKALTDDKGRDIVLDWQARPSSIAPTLKVYGATLDPRRPLKLRYALRDDDAYDSVSIALSGESAGGGGELGGSPAKVRADGHVVTTTLPAELVREFLASLDHGFRFCVSATDPYFNGPTNVCAKLKVKTR